MKKLINIVIVVLAVGMTTLYAMPDKDALEKARPLIQELMADDFAALKADKKTHEAVGDAAMKLLSNAETEAAKFLLCKAAFGLYIRGKAYDKAADVLETFRESISDLPTADLVELVQKNAKGVRGKDAPKLFAAYRALQAKATGEKERDKARTALAANPSDATLRRAYAEWCVHAGDWKSALASFAKLEGDFAKAVQNESSDRAAAADFWWSYEPTVKSTNLKEPNVAFKRHAVALYKRSQADGSLTGLRKNLAEKRIAQLEEETADPAAPVAVATSPRASMTPSLTGLYLVIDLSAGPNATSYPVSSLAAEPSGGWTDEYKTTKLVLRRIKKGTFTMGSPQNEPGREGNSWCASERQRRVTLKHDFYIGIFPVTQRQWELVMGNNPSKGRDNPDAASCPVEMVSYQMIRGTILGCAVPIDGRVDDGSFLSNLRMRSGLKSLDLPTGAQWEFACRAGTTTATPIGKFDDKLIEKVAWGKSNSLGRTHEVGKKKMNPWGLYDVLGNVMEICRDRISPNKNMESLLNLEKDGMYEFVGGRVESRSGSKMGDSTSLRCAYRINSSLISSKEETLGFRVSVTLP